MFGIDEIYEEMLLEAKSPEEIKKILEYQFVRAKGVPQEVLDRVFNIDPTSKKSYTRWVLMQWDSAADEITEALENGSLKEMFNYFKSESANGLNLPAMASFKEAMEKLPNSTDVLRKSGNADDPENDFDIVFKSAEWIVAKPNTYEADRKLGEGCKWCTAGFYGDKDDYWKRYIEEGPLWVNFDLRTPQTSPYNHKTYAYTRYQFLFEYQRYEGEMMDIDDNRIDFDTINMPQDVFDFYESINKRYGETLLDCVDEDERRERRLNARMARAIVVAEYHDLPLYLMPDDPDDEEFMLYDGNDEEDPIEGAHFRPDSYLVTVLQEEPKVAILKDTSGYMWATRFWMMSGQWPRWKLDDEVVDYGSLGDGYVYYRFGFNEALVLSPKLVNHKNGVKFDGVEDITIPSYEDGARRDDEALIEIVGRNGSHDLFKLSSKDDVVKVINADMPIGGGRFTIKIDSQGRRFVEGRLNTHYIDGDADEALTNSKAKVVAASSYDDNLLVVDKFVGNGRWMVSIYSTETNEYLIPFNYTNFDDNFRFIFLSTQDRKTAVFDCESKDIVCKLDDEPKVFQMRRNILGVENDDGTWTLYDADNQYDKLIRVGSPRKLNWRYLAVKTMEGENIYDVVERKYILPSAYFKITWLDDDISRSMVLLNHKSRSVSDLFDIDKVQYLARDVVSTSKITSYFSFECFLAISDGSAVAVSDEGEIKARINGNVIRGGIDNRCGTVPVKENDMVKWYKFQNGAVDIVPSAYGVKASLIYSMCGGEVKMKTDKGTEFSYFPFINDFRTENPEETKDEIMATLYPQKAQVTEAFNRIYNKIKGNGLEQCSE